MTLAVKALVAATLASLVLVTAAAGGPPTREPILVEGFDLENVCPFPVVVDVTANKEFVTFFDDGRLHVTGKLFVTVTNAESGGSLDLNISGPAFISPESERSGGRGLLILFPEDEGGPGLLVLAGRLDIIRGEDGFIDDFTVRGRSTDVCAALAD